MNHLLKLSFCALAGTAMIACGNHATTQADSVPYAELESGFITPPDSILTSVYWYWISNNISEEGVIKDLESMKKAGINRAFIGNIATGDQFVASESYVKVLQDSFNSLACEMEGAAVGLVAYQYGVPFVVIRCMSDKADGLAHETYSGFGDQAADNSASIVMEMLGNMQ